MGITPIAGINSYDPVSSVQPMNYAVSNDSDFSDVYATETTKKDGVVTGAQPVQYPNATIDKVDSEKEVDPMERLRQNQEVSGQFNSIAGKYASMNVGYSKMGAGQTYGMEGSRLDLYA